MVASTSQAAARRGAYPNSRTERGYPVLRFARNDAMRALLRKYEGAQR